VGAVDGEGWLSLHGRSDDVINFGGTSRLPVAIVPVPRIIRSPDGKILRGRLLEEYKLSATSPG